MSALHRFGLLIQTEHSTLDLRDLYSSWTAMTDSTTATTNEANSEFDQEACMQLFDPDSDIVKLKAPPPSNGFGDTEGLDPNAPALVSNV